MLHVFILAHCRNPDLFGATNLVFDTVRVGFPTAEIKVWVSNIPDGLGREFDAAMLKAGCRLDLRSCPTVHHDWINLLAAEEDDPFFICDTDMVFWKNCEEWDLSGHYLAGRFIPGFYEEWTKCAHKPRLHTSLMYFDPKRLRVAVDFYYRQFPKTPFSNLRPELIRGRLFTEHEKGHYFFDTCALLYHAIGGQPFTDEQLDCFDHLNCGTYADLIAPHLSLGSNMVKNNQHLIDNPKEARGIWRQQENYFEHFAVTN